MCVCECCDVVLPLPPLMYPKNQGQEQGFLHVYEDTAKYLLKIPQKKEEATKNTKPKKGKNNAREKRRQRATIK